MRALFFCSTMQWSISAIFTDLFLLWWAYFSYFSNMSFYCYYHSGNVFLSLNHHKPFKLPTAQYLQHHSFFDKHSFWKLSKTILNFLPNYVPKLCQEATAWPFFVILQYYVLNDCFMMLHLPVDLSVKGEYLCRECWFNLQLT